MSDNYMFEEEEFTSQFNGETLKRIIQQLAPYKLWTIGFLVSVASVSFLDALFVVLTKGIIDEGIIAGNMQRLIELTIIYVIVTLIFAGFVFMFIYLAGILGQRVQYDLRKKMFNHLQSLSLSYYNKTPVGWMISRVTSDSERIAELVTWGFLDSTWAVMNIVITLIFMATINWQLTLVVAAMVPVLVLVAIWFKQKILVEYRESRKFNSKITAAYNENLTGVRVVQAMNRQERNLGEFSELTDSMYQSSYRAAWYSALFLPAVLLVSSFGVGSIAAYGGWQFTLGGMTIGGIQAFVTFIIFMMFPIQDMARVYASMQHAIASAERSFSLLDTESDIVDRENAVDPGTIAGSIEFDNVTFYYDEDKPVLDDFNLNVKAGETIALVGATGGGKSTIVNLLCRFYEPREGVIRINGKDYTELTLHSIQSRIGVVLQTPHLFSGKISDNIRYGRLDATDEEVIEAAKLASAHEFISRFEKGYDEPVGEGGVLLSVGQKQLISLARAILADPEILVMDEATSSVDTLTEELIQRGMDNLMRGRTSFVIAHRLSTIKSADRILVIENGKISEQGSHQELLAQRGHYYGLYTKQFRRQAEAAYDFDVVAS